MNILADLKELFFPRFCLGCGKKLSGGEQALCTSCQADLPYISPGYKPDSEIEKYFWGRFPLGRVSSLLYYAKGGTVAHILYGMKYHGRKQLCRQMGRQLANHLEHEGFFSGIDFLIPVPLHKKRMRLRGYNQSEQLALGISDRTNIPVCTNAIVRTYNNISQTHKSGYERQQSVIGLFQATGQADALAGKHVLLIDDVLTTGATLTACADALSGIKDIRISITTLAWAK